MDEQHIYTCYPFGPKGNGTSVGDPVRIAIEELEFTAEGRIDPQAIAALQAAVAMRSHDFEPKPIGVVLFYDPTVATESIANFQAKAEVLRTQLAALISEECIVSVAVKL